MTQLPAKLTGHKNVCPRCHSADGISDLCRVGRRLFLSWFERLDQDTKMFTLVGFPPEMRTEILNLVDIGSEVVFGDKIQ